ncbi:MAG: InlB B-repeat-containing protein [Lachnospiraceae bacterium]|nr:InlB B-repeat-containing protein [Lachnospiraceae bacterium]
MRHGFKRSTGMFFAVLVTVFLGLCADRTEAKADTPAYCNGKHTEACYEYGTALHKHTDAKGKAVTASTQSKRGGCFTVYNPGYSYTEICGGKLEQRGVTPGHYHSSYTCDCIDNMEYLTHGGVGITHTRKTDTIYRDRGYTEVWTGECTRCGAAAVLYGEFEYYYHCTMCGLGTEYPELNTPHFRTYSKAAYYSAGCGKSTSTFYYDNGEGREAKPVCDRTVTALVPDEAAQTVDISQPEIMRSATAYFLDGHSEKVMLSAGGYSIEKLNEWQELTCSYGEFYFDTSKKRPVKGPATVKINVFIQGTGTLSVKSQNPFAGRPEIEGKGNTAEIFAGTETVIKGNPGEGYHVLKWTFSDGTESVISTDGNEKSEIKLKMPSHDLEVCCVYEANKYHVIFDAGAGRFPNGEKVMEKVLTYGRVYDLSEEPELSGMIFTGWRIRDELTGKLSDALIKTGCDILQIPSDHVLVAEWAEMGPKWFYASYDDPFPKLFTPVMPGYTFEGWFMDERPCNDGWGMEVNEGVIVKYDHLYDGRTIHKNKNDYVIYAGWEPKVITVTFVCPEDVFLDSTVMITGAHDSLVEYEIIPGKGNASGKARKKVMYDMFYSELPEPVKLDKNGNQDTKTVFMGWSTTGDADGLILPDMVVSAEHDITVYPVFLQGDYVNVTLDVNGGVENRAFSDGTRSNPFKAAVGKVYGDTLGFIPTYEGHTFKGWNLYRDGSGKISVNTTTRVVTDKDHTLYAKWERYVLYNANDRDVSGQPITSRAVGATARNTFVNSDVTPQEVKRNGFYRTGYTFLGWNTERDGSGTWYVNREEADTCPDAGFKTHLGDEFHETVTLYAQWDSRIELILDERGGSIKDGGMTRIVSSYGNTVPAVVTVPEKYGYTFTGYYTGIRGSGEKVYDENGGYCYENAVMTVDGRVALVEENYAFLGDNDLSVTPYTAISWSMMEKLYAGWVYSYEPDPLDLGVEVTLTNEFYDVGRAIPSTERIDITGAVPESLGIFTGDRLKVPFMMSSDIVFQTEDPETERLRITDINGNPIDTHGKKIIPLAGRGTFESVSIISADIRASNEKGVLFESTCATDHGEVFYEHAFPDVESPNGEYPVSIVLHTDKGEDIALTTGQKVVIHDPVAAAARISIDDKNTLESSETEPVTGVTFDADGMPENAIVLKEGYNLLTIEVSHDGDHIKEKGYGEGEYSVSLSGAKLIKREFAVFPFDVWVQSPDGLEKKEAGTRIEVTEGKVRVYLTNEIRTADHEIFVYVQAVNCPEETDDINAPVNDALYGKNVNTGVNEYGAVTKVKLTVIPDMFDYGADMINNEAIKNFDPDGVPVMYFGNKLDLYAGEGAEGYRVTAVPEASLIVDGNVRNGNVYVTVGMDEKVKAYIDLLEYTGSVYFNKDRRGSFVMPYLSYCVLEENVDSLEETAAQNTLNGDEWFFERECDVELVFFIFAEDENGNVFKGKTPVKVRIKRPG